MAKFTINNGLYEDYCSFEVSELLNKAGLNCMLKVPSDGIMAYGLDDKKLIYNSRANVVIGGILAPTHHYARKWLLENFKIYAFADPIYKFAIWTPRVMTKEFFSSTHDNYNGQLEFTTEAEAMEAALLHALKEMVPKQLEDLDKALPTNNY